MNTEDKILELVKEKPLLMNELQDRLQEPDGVMRSACDFLENYGLIVMDSGGDMVAITARGLQLLNLPDLPEDELPSDQLELLERHWSDEMDKALDQEADLNLKDVEEKRREKMTRFIFEIDVVRKDDVEVVEGYAKRALERRIISVDGHEFITVASVRKKGENKGEWISEAVISKAAISAIKAREDKRQQEIAEGDKR